MRRRIARLLPFIVLALFAAFVGAALWLLHTQSGARWLWARAEAALPLSAAAVDGSLTGGLTLRDLEYRDAAHAISVPRVMLAVNPDLFPTRLVVETLTLDAVTIRASGAARPDDAEDGEDGTLADVLPRLRPPVPVRLEKGRAGPVSYVAANGGRREILTRLELSGRLFETLEVETFELRTPALGLSLSGGVELEAPFALTRPAEVSASLAGKTPVSGTARLSGTLAELAVAVEGESPAMTVSGTVSATEPDPRFDLTAESPRLTWPPAGDDPVVRFRDVLLRAHGRLSDYAYDADAVIESRAAAPVAATARGRGSLERLDVAHLAFSSEALAGTASGQLTFAPSFAIGADVAIERLEASRWLDDWPPAAVVEGRIAGSYDGTRLEVRRVTLAQAGGPGRLEGSGVVDLAGAVVDGRLAWQNLQWPLPPAVANVTSPAGHLEVDGTPDDWSVSGELTVGAPELPDGRFRISGQGDTERLGVDIADSEVLGGRVTGRVAAAWRGRRAWSASLAAENVRTKPLVPEWPGQLSATFTARGARAPFELELDIAKLDGRLRGRPVSARGRLVYEDDRLLADDLAIATGGSRIELDGDYEGADGMSFALDVSSLGDFLPGAAGSVRASGSLAAAPQLPRLRVELTAERLRFGEFAAGTLSLGNAPSADTPLALSAAAGELRFAGNTLDTASLTLDGDAARHRLVLEAARADSTARLALEGGLEAFGALPEASWRGRLAEAAVNGGDLLSMSLRTPAAVHASAKAATLNRSCLDATGGTAAVCASASWQRTGAYAGVIELAAMPLELMRLAVDTELGFSQTLTGTVQVSRPPRGRVSAGGHLTVSPGQIRNPLDERLTLTTRPGFAQFALDEGSLLSGELRLPFSDAAEIAGKFRVVDVARGPESAVEGHLRANVRDIGVGANILPLIDEAGGRLEADIRIDGSLKSPQFTGTASLRDGLLSYDALGLRVDDIQLESEIRRGNRVEIRSSFRAGEGRGEIRTSADYLQGRQAGLELSLAGDNLTLIDARDLVVKVNPDLTVGVHGDDITINGRVTIPAARLSAVTFTSQTVSESPDVEFVGDRRAAADEQRANGSPLSFGGSVDLVLGDEVVIDVDVADVRVSGSSTFSWHGPAMPDARGQYDATGKFEAYGQLLEITDGSIRYPGVPADRPELRIRAEREIFGNSEIRRAGVLVTGTATQPFFEVYTTPRTNEDRALRLLATGNDFDYEQGVGSVDVGTYISPRLYASYGIGLFDKGNVVSVRYDLTSVLGIKATSGKRASGVDLSYTIEH